MEHLFSPNSSGDLRSDARQSQIIGGMQMQTILKLLGGYSQIIWGIYPHPPGFRHLCGPGTLRPTNRTPMQSICLSIALQLFCHIDPPR